MSRGTRLLLGVGLVGVLVLGWRAAASAADGVPVAAPIVVTHSFHEVADTLRRNETVSDLLARHSIAGSEMLDLLDAMDGLNPRKVRAGQVFEFATVVGETVPERVRVRLTADAFLRADRDSTGWRGTTDPIGWTVHTARIAGSVQSSLYETVDNLIPDSALNRRSRQLLVYALADEIFAWEIDFTRDLRPGDEFTVVYEFLTSSLGEVRFGRVLAADIHTAGVENTAYVFSDDKGGNAYYDARGVSLRRAFKMYPVQFRRISSNFSRARLHPVLGISRPHLGTDYAADIGTPIEATADGTVIRAGRWGGYGIMVAIRHPRGIETRYAHMSRLAQGIHVGVRVHQEQVIGYVGMTGLANGPHVHYEFLKNGQQVNSRRVDLGDGTPVPASRRDEFETQRAAFDRLLGRDNGGAIARSD
jgi:murein DD-endopeptidase MepM/ murein hydrolase activator NlpD